MNEPGQGDCRDKSDVDLFKLIQVAGRSLPASRDAFSEIYRRYAKGLQSHGLKMYPATLKRSGDVHDFVQQVFLISGKLRFSSSTAPGPIRRKRCQSW